MADSAQQSSSRGVTMGVLLGACQATRTKLTRPAGEELWTSTSTGTSRTQSIQSCWGAGRPFGQNSLALWGSEGWPL